jgi:hypothetical protein
MQLRFKPSFAGSVDDRQGLAQHSQGLVPIPRFRQELSQQTQKAGEMKPHAKRSFIADAVAHLSKAGLRCARGGDRPAVKDLRMRQPDWIIVLHGEWQHGAGAIPHDVRSAADLMEPAVQIQDVAQGVRVV